MHRVILLLQHPMLVPLGHRQTRRFEGGGDGQLMQAVRKGSGAQLLQNSLHGGEDERRWAPSRQVLVRLLAQHLAPALRLSAQSSLHFKVNLWHEHEQAVQALPPLPAAQPLGVPEFLQNDIQRGQAVVVLGVRGCSVPQQHDDRLGSQELTGQMQWGSAVVSVKTPGSVRVGRRAMYPVSLL